MKWRTVPNPMRDDGVFVCTGPDRTYPDGQSRLPETITHTQLPHRIADQIVEAHNRVVDDMHTEAHQSTSIEHAREVQRLKLEVEYYQNLVGKIAYPDVQNRDRLRTEAIVAERRAHNLQIIIDRTRASLQRGGMSIPIAILDQIIADVEAEAKGLTPQSSTPNAAKGLTPLSPNEPCPTCDGRQPGCPACSRPKAGDLCATCGQRLAEVTIDCLGKRQRGEPLPTILACRCLHPGDYLCNCHNPCSSIL